MLKATRELITSPNFSLALLGADSGSANAKYCKSRVCRQTLPSAEGSFLLTSLKAWAMIATRETNPPKPRTMKRSIDFSEVTDYKLELGNGGLTLKIIQGNVVTDVHVTELSKSQSSVASALSKVVKAAKPKAKKSRPNSWRSWPKTKLDNDKVLEIRQLWPDMLKEHGTKTSACKVLGEIYGCSSANIGLVVDRKIWTHV